MHISFAGGKLYSYFVEKNGFVKQEYENYLRINRRDGKTHRLREWFFLVRVKVAYFILNRDSNRVKNVAVKELEMDSRSESEIEKRCHPNDMVKKLLKYELISFDVFDTLIFRPFDDPKILFNLLEDDNEIEHFADLRIKAENDSRNISFAAKGTREITIEDIYEYIETRTGIDKEYGIKCELEKEYEYCFPNPYMQAVYNMLLEAGKQIVITSDMYLRKKDIAELLRRNGYMGYEDIFVSSDYRVSKRSGKLYSELIREYSSCKSMVHVGDNYYSDVVMAEKAGLSTMYYRNINELGKKYRTVGMSRLIGSFYAGIVNSRLHNGIREYSGAYEYGYVNGGLYCLGYAEWIHNLAVSQKADRIIFLSRDGAIYKQVYDALFSDIPSRYLYWSRIATIKYDIERNRYDFLLRVTLNPILNKKKIVLGDSLSSVGLGELIPILTDYGLNSNQYLNEENRVAYEDFLIRNIKKIESIYKKEKEVAKDYICSIVGQSKRVVIVDVGWAGSGPISISNLLSEYGIDCEVIGALAASTNRGNKRVLDNQLKTYMFSFCENRNHFDYHFRKEFKNSANILFEMLTQDDQPSFKGFSNQLTEKMEFTWPFVEGYDFINEVHKGVMDFVDDYVMNVKSASYLLNIPGYDAYCAYRVVLANLDNMVNRFHDVPCEADSGDFHSTCTISEYLKSRGAI